MIIYKCSICGDEMFSDVYKIKEVYDGVFYEVEGKSITRSEQFDESKIGANASAEEPQECADSVSSESGVDIILNHKLQETSFDKKSYLGYLKTYMKQIKTQLEKDQPDKVEKFQTSAQAAVKQLIPQFKDLQFFTGESMNIEGMVGLLNYREDGITPYMLFFKDGLIVEKC